MPWFDLFVKALPPSAMDRARQIAAAQRAAEEERRRREGLKGKAKPGDGGIGSNPDTSIQRRPIGVRSGGPFVIYAGLTPEGYRVVSTGGTFLDTNNGNVEVQYSAGEDIQKNEMVGVYLWWDVGPGFPFRQRLTFEDRRYSPSGGPFGEASIDRMGDAIFLEGDPIEPIPINKWTGPGITGGGIYYGEIDGYTGWLVAPWLVNLYFPQEVNLQDGDHAGAPVSWGIRIPDPPGDFTIEGWCRGRIRADFGYFQLDWTHVAFCRKAGVLTVWIDGDDSLYPQETLRENLGANIHGFGFGIPSAFDHINLSGSGNFDFGQTRIDLGQALYDAPRIVVPTGPWV